MVTKEELLNRCKEENIDLGSKPGCTINSFVSNGLIGRPTRHGLGRGKGVRVYFSDTAFGEIKEIVTLRKQGLTWKEIKDKKKNKDGWLSSVNQIMKSSKTGQDALESIRKLPVLSDSEKGRLKLVCDLADHLSRIIAHEVRGFFGSDFNNASKDHAKEAVRDTLQGFIESNVLYDIALPDEDYAEYLEGKKPQWKPLTETERDIIKSIMAAKRSDSEANKCKPADL